MNAFDNNVVNLINTGSQNVITLITPLMAACFGVYVSLVMMSYWRGGTDMPIQDFMMKMVAWVVILTLGMNITYYTQYVVPFLNGLGDDLATALSGNVSTGSALDTITNAYVQAMSTLYDHSDGIQDTINTVASSESHCSSRCRSLRSRPRTSFSRSLPWGCCWHWVHCSSRWRCFQRRENSSRRGLPSA